MKAVLFSEESLAETGRLWSDAVAHVARKLGRVKPLAAGDVPADRRAAVAHLDRWAGADVAGWAGEVERFYEDHLPLYVRPSPELNATVRRLTREGVRLAAWSPGPPGAARALVHALGLGRRIEQVLVDPSADAPLALARALGVDDDPGDVLVVSGEPTVLARAREHGLARAAALWPGAPKAPLLATLPTLLAASPSDLVELALSGRLPARR